MITLVSQVHFLPACIFSKFSQELGPAGDCELRPYRAPGAQLNAPDRRVRVLVARQISGSLLIARQQNRPLLYAAPRTGPKTPRENLRAEMEAALPKIGQGPLGPLLNHDSVTQVWDDFLRQRTSWSRIWSLYVLERWCELNSVAA